MRLASLLAVLAVLSALPEASLALLSSDCLRTQARAYAACARIAAEHLGKLVEEGRVIREERKWAFVPATIVSLMPFFFAETRYRPSPAEMAAAAR